MVLTVSPCLSVFVRGLQVGNPDELIDIKRSEVSRQIFGPQVFEPSGSSNMRILFLLTLATSLSAAILCTVSPVNAVTPVTAATAPPRKKMKSFASERDLERYFREVAEKWRR